MNIRHYCLLHKCLYSTIVTLSSYERVETTEAGVNQLFTRIVRGRFAKQHYDFWVIPYNK